MVDFFVKDLLGSGERHCRDWPPQLWLGHRHPNKASDITVKQVLAGAEAKIETAFVDQPLVEATVRHAVGFTALSLGDYTTAEHHVNCAVQLDQASWPGTSGHDPLDVTLGLSDSGKNHDEESLQQCLEKLQMMQRFWVREKSIPCNSWRPWRFCL